MSWLLYLQAFWPVAVVLVPLIVGGTILWLRTQFATKADLTKVDDAAKAAIKELGQEADALERDIADRFERGSRKFADHDKRLAVVEKECEGAPTKADLAQLISVLGGRMSGVESAVKGVEKQLSTQHDYLRTLIEGRSGGQ